MDTLLRHWHMLCRVPRFPRKISTADLETSLAAAGYPTSRRTIQRDLEKLSVLFPLCKDGCKPVGWSWQADAEIFDLPGMETTTALTFSLIETYLARLLPKGCVSALAPHMRRADNLLAQLEGHNLSRWPEKIRTASLTQVLSPPETPAAVANTIYEALFYNLQFRGNYLSRGDSVTREFVVNPLGLLFSDPVIYLVATFWTYQDVRLLPLHRFESASLLSSASQRPADFDLDAFLRNGSPLFGVHEHRTIKLVFRMNSEVAKHLQECRLSEDQTVTETDDGFTTIAATVAETPQLHWWLLGFGAKVEVLAPPGLRAEFAAIASDMYRNYDSAP